MTQCGCSGKKKKAKTKKKAEKKHCYARHQRLFAKGIPGAAGVTVVGVFLPGGPIADTPALKALTLPGQVMDPTRVMVTSSSNFGAVKAQQEQRPGSVLTLAQQPRHRPLCVPSCFAKPSCSSKQRCPCLSCSCQNNAQVSTQKGDIQLFTAQSPPFLNGINNPAAPTADQASVSNPLRLSNNNAFGRVWPASSPYGAFGGPGSSSIDDPNGRPLADAPNPVDIGGVYFGSLTNRRPQQVIPGALTLGGLGTALIGRSPDGRQLAVFAVAVADGSIVQENTLRGLDGLVPPGFLVPDRRRPETGVGMLVAYEPQLSLFVTQASLNNIVVLRLGTTGPPGDQVFSVVSTSVLSSPAFAGPIDLAPVHRETQNIDHASNTTLAPGSDLYVCNRDNSTVARITADGTFVASRTVRLQKHQVLNGLASFAGKIWCSFIHTDKHGNPSSSKGGLLHFSAF